MDGTSRPGGCHTRTVAELSLDPDREVLLTVKATDLEVYTHTERQRA